jgi:WD40 repeat protein
MVTPRRLWRVKEGRLHHANFDLGRHSSETFFDVAFQPDPLDHRVRLVGIMLLKHQGIISTVLVAQSNGFLVVATIATNKLQVGEPRKLHDKNIRAIALTEGLCISASEDGTVRVWPDYLGGAHAYRDFLLEASTTGVGTSLSVAPDGLKVLIGTSAATVDILDIPTHTHKVWSPLLVSHCSDFCTRPRRPRRCVVF